MNINYKTITVLMACIIILPSCFFSEKKEKNVENNPTLYVVNVLSKELYDDAHIKGSIHKDLDDLIDGSKSPIKSWSKQTPVVFYCSNYQCTASSYAAKMFKKEGFEHVYAYEAGMAEWYQLSKNDSSYMLEGPAAESYLNQEVPVPEHADNTIDIISSADLKQKMIAAGLL